MTTDRPGTGSEIEQGVGLVRLVLALVGSAVAFGSRAAEREFQLAVTTLVAIAGCTVALSLLRRGLARVGTGPVIDRVVLQAADVAAAVGLVVVISTVAPDAGWVLLALPIVISSLRLDPVGVLLTWAGTTAGYLVVLWLDWVPPGPESFETALVVERPGALLALAAAVAIMTRWLQHGWIRQSELTDDVEAHLAYVRSIEDAGRAMRQADRDGVVEICLRHLLELGFSGATAGRPGDGLVVRGEGQLLPIAEEWPVPEVGAIELTEWRDRRATRVYGAAAVEPRSGLLITGWSTADPTTRSLESLTDLLAYTTISIELAELLAATRHEADHDPLTGLMNRAALDRHLERVAAADDKVALLFIDVDHFKRINDLHGHQIGDAVLVEVAGQLEATLPASAVPARFGGDEFVVVLTGDDAARATAYAERLRDARQAPVVVNGVEIDVRLSIGVGTAEGAIDPATLAARADQALYQAKESGRNTVRTHRRDDPVPDDRPSRASTTTIAASKR